MTDNENPSVLTDGGGWPDDDESRSTDWTPPGHQGTGDDSFLWVGGQTDVTESTGQKSRTSRGESGRNSEARHSNETTTGQVPESAGGGARFPVSEPDGTRAGGGRAAQQRDVLHTAFDRMERRLDRLHDLAKELRVAGINATLKHHRSDDADLKHTHDELKSHADGVAKEVERLQTLLEDVRGECRRLHQQRSNRSARAADRDGRPQSTPNIGSSGTQQRRIHGRTGPPITVDHSAADRSDGEKEDPPPGNTPQFDPVRSLIPGVKLRDLWRATGSNGGTGVPSDRERWILETTSRTDEAVPEFAPEVREFALDDDEIPFGELLELAFDDS